MNTPSGYPTGTSVKTSTSGMSPEMEAKFLWLMDQVVGKASYPFGYTKEQWDKLPPAEQTRLQNLSVGEMKPQQVVPFTDEQQKALDMAKDPFDKDTGWQKYLNEYQGYVTEGISDRFDQEINKANLGAAGAGAFGGARQGIMHGSMLGDKSRAIGESLAQGYGQAWDLYDRGIARMMGAGSVQQQQQQQQSDANYQAYLQNMQNPYQRLGYMSDVFTGTPTGQMSMTMGTSPVSNPLSQALGAGLGIMGLGTAGGYMT
jgi:hypothetical protein